MSHRRRREWRINLSPPLLLTLLYALSALLGAVLLRLPWASEAGISWSDALFTAVSAITVTGLVVVDIGSQLSGFGQVMVLLLIQLGGLGLMTFATLILASLGLPIGFEHKLFLRDDLSQTSISDLLYLVRIIFLVALISELIGTLLLACIMVPAQGWAEGLWYALFHAVSAFNNAGFSLYPDSLTRWATNPLMNLTVPLLYLFGGLGFGVWLDLAKHKAWRPLALHSKLMLLGTAVLIILPLIMFAAFEWHNPATLGQFDAPGDKLMVSWFQATTPRTAGFNSIDIGGLHDTTVLLFLFLMFVGGGTTSTAGGIKVTTFMVLILATWAFFRRRAYLRAFHRSLELDEVLKVMALLTLSSGLIMLAIFLMTLTHDGNFLNLVFEVVSAFSTVGLTRGSTPELDGLGRVVAMIMMFLGRVGPLTLGFFLATSVPARVRYPASRVYLG